MLADVVQLMDDHRTLGVARVGDGAEASMTASSPAPEVAASQYGRRVHRHRLDDDHRRPATGPLEVVAEVTVAWQSALGHVGGVRTEHDAVAQRDMAQLQRPGEVRKHRGAHRRTVRVLLDGVNVQVRPD